MVVVAPSIGACDGGQHGFHWHGITHECEPLLGATAAEQIRSVGNALFKDGTQWPFVSPIEGPLSGRPAECGATGPCVRQAQQQRHVLTLDALMLNARAGPT